MEPIDGENEKRPVHININYFAKHTAHAHAHVGTIPRTYVLVHACWLNCHPQKFTCGKPVTV